MKRNGAVVAVVLAAAGAGIVLIGCDGITGPGDEYGTAELIYELDSDLVPNPALLDVSDDGEVYLVGGYNDITGEGQFWFAYPDGRDPYLIASNPELGVALFSVLSPDKAHIAYEDWDGIYVLPVSGGEPWRIYRKAVDARPYHWVDDVTVLIDSLEDGWYVKTVNINTSEVDTLAKIEGISNLAAAYLSPDGNLIACSADYRDPSFAGQGAPVNAFDLDGLKERLGAVDCGYRTSGIILILDTQTACVTVINGDGYSGNKNRPKTDDLTGLNGIFRGLSSYFSKAGAYLFRVYKPYTGKYKELEPGSICRGWSPDGTRVLFTGDDVQYYDLRNEEYVSVFHSNKLVLDPYFRWWGPDGKSIIAFANADDGDLRVYSIAID
jgi:hypothetical protein